MPFTKKIFPLFFNISLLTLGTFGNFIDRIRLKYVVGFIYFKHIDFPLFNVADMYIITISCILFIYLIMFYYKNEDFKNK